MRVFSAFFALAAFALGSAASTEVAKKLPKGFATTNGTQFSVDGQPFNFYGANSYWLPMLTTEHDIDLTLSSMQKAGVKVMRTWGFNAINATELPYALNTSLTYYQVWNSSEWTLNEGSQGLARLDNIVNKAGHYGIKLIVTFTNNWVGYGGAELYLNWILGANATHDEFYTNPKVVASYQRYVKAIVSRYKSSPNIFAWELMNEARCSGDLASSAACHPGSGTLHTWYSQQAAYVKSLDPYHMVTTGGEGQFYITDPTENCYAQLCVNDYSFNGGAGEDFVADLGIKDIDFAVYHMYPLYWETPFDHPGSNVTLAQWGAFWVQAHATAAAAAGKPLVLEEFGYTGVQNRTEIYPLWVGTALATGHAGVMPWQWGQLGLTEFGGNRVFKYADVLLDGASPQDGFAVYPNETATWNVFEVAAKVQQFKSLLDF